MKLIPLLTLGIPKFGMTIFHLASGREIEVSDEVATALLDDHLNHSFPITLKYGEAMTASADLPGLGVSEFVLEDEPVDPPEEVVELLKALDGQSTTAILTVKEA